MAIGRQTKMALKVAGKQIQNCGQPQWPQITDTILLVAFICNGNIQ